jgi:Tfp pilus assembly ATPase PilU
MTDPTNRRPRPPLVLPPKFRDVTAEKVGTVTVVIGATAAGKGTKPG